ncbi:hypothetical protein [Sphingobium cupriresistens]|uniref:Uncharacterized protein n=1 Tax=Sphingobium cupriresistens LL01 TaxID=1420583 RepID=A0A0J7Y524_9SPHN|nr:hypothetical protein [Sphingobium cupriresistens]KMS58767.1 hypothetical protein V473_07050 [Sphingobium cupriresistens LL01]
MADEPTTAQWLLGGGGLVACGAGLKWLVEWWSKRDERRQAREDRLRTQESQQVQGLNVRIDQLEDKLTKLTVAVNILVAKEFRSDPHSPELLQVQAILGDAFPLHLHVPQDMIDAIGKLS